MLRRAIQTHSRMTPIHRVRTAHLEDQGDGTPNKTLPVISSPPTMRKERASCFCDSLNTSLRLALCFFTGKKIPAHRHSLEGGFRSLMAHCAVRQVTHFLVAGLSSVHSCLGSCESSPMAGRATSIVTFIARGFAANQKVTKKMFVYDNFREKKTRKIYFNVIRILLCKTLQRVCTHLKKARKALLLM